ncbi:hypothetical protein CAEBREN_05160 [Caenorhabditis brenneri]|uniref:F-box domain-containing protein n=1 Tax=Caenorhabditis brenneri TaxID=135651 RepID=G0NJC9_CAEBE|nr:hypothetical protein CAEBREN_05160 [Caenorhabditis brenneri]
MLPIFIPSFLISLFIVAIAHILRKWIFGNEEISDLSRPNLLKMPVVVMEEVLKNLDIKAIFRLRKVCRSLRSSINGIRPELHLKSLSFELPLTKESLESYMKEMSKFNRDLQMVLHKPRTGCVLEWEQGGFSKCSEIPMEEAESFMKNTKLTVDELKIDLCYFFGDEKEHIEEKEEDLQKFFDSMKTLFKNRSHILKIKNFRLEVHHLLQATNLLEFIDPKSFDTASVQFREWFSEPETLEHEKNAEVLKVLESSILNRVGIAKSVNTFPDWTEVIQLDILAEVKKLHISTPNIKTLTYKSGFVDLAKNQLISRFGQFESFNEEFEDDFVYHNPMRGRRERRSKQKTWTWLKSIPGSTEKWKTTLSVGLENYIAWSKV